VKTVNAIANPRSLLGVLDMKEILSFRRAGPGGPSWGITP
jgi:hypothetical protein